MESTLEVARRAVEADTRRDWSSGAQRLCLAPRALRRLRCCRARCAAFFAERSARWQRTRVARSRASRVCNRRN